MTKQALDQTVISVRVSRETADRLNAIAAAEYRSTAAELRRLIQARVNEAELQEEAA
jgi:predicted DNA-binding protein